MSVIVTKLDYERNQKLIQFAGTLNVIQRFGT